MTRPALTYDRRPHVGTELTWRAVAERSVPSPNGLARPEFATAAGAAW